MPHGPQVQWLHALEVFDHGAVSIALCTALPGRSGRSAGRHRIVLEPRVIGVTKLDMGWLNLPIVANLKYPFPATSRGL